MSTSESRKWTCATGAASEYRVVADLLGRGWHVFRSTSHNSPFDLVISKRGRLIRVEVKTGIESRNGKHTSSHCVADFDVLAVVYRDVITYTPNIEQMDGPIESIRSTEYAVEIL